MKTLKTLKDAYVLLCKWVIIACWAVLIFAFLWFIVDAVMR